VKSVLSIEGLLSQFKDYYLNSFYSNFNKEVRISELSRVNSVEPIDLSYQIMKFMLRVLFHFICNKFSDVIVKFCPKCFITFEVFLKRPAAIPTLFIERNNNASFKNVFGRYVTFNIKFGLECSMNKLTKLKYFSGKVNLFNCLSIQIITLYSVFVIQN
jgi:hypothetical protein